MDDDILSMYVSVVCSMRDVRNVVHVKFDTDHPPTLNLCCIILIIKICLVLITTHTVGHTCQYPGCKEVLVLDGNMKNRCDVCMAKDAVYPFNIQAYLPGLSSLAAEHPYSLSLETAKNMAV